MLILSIENFIHLSVRPTVPPPPKMAKNKGGQVLPSTLLIDRVYDMSTLDAIRAGAVSISVDGEIHTGTQSAATPYDSPARLFGGSALYTTPTGMDTNLTIPIHLIIFKRRSEFACSEWFLVSLEIQETIKTYPS